MWKKRQFTTILIGKQCCKMNLRNSLCHCMRTSSRTFIADSEVSFPKNFLEDNLS